MHLEQLIKEIIAATPGKCVVGKKRLQKLVFLLRSAGIDTEANFSLRDYGPFSREVEYAADLMAIFGDIIEEDVSVGYSNYMATAYKLPDGPVPTPPDELIRVISHLDKFRTVELEIASTIQFFEDQGQSRKSACNLTKSIKPSKSTDQVLKSASAILAFVAEKNGSSSNPRSHS